MKRSIDRRQPRERSFLRLAYLLVSLATLFACGPGPGTEPRRPADSPHEGERRSESGHEDHREEGRHQRSHGENGSRADAVEEAARGGTEGRYDLERDESRGGHTLSRHVGRTDQELAERLQRERNISAASTWTDRETAEETVARGLRAQQQRIEDWLGRGERRPNLALHFDAGRTIGRSLRRGQSQSEPCRSAVIVLRGDGPDGFYVLTTYPEARE